MWLKISTVGNCTQLKRSEWNFLKDAFRSLSRVHVIYPHFAPNQTKIRAETPKFLF